MRRRAKRAKRTLVCASMEGLGFTSAARVGSVGHFIWMETATKHQTMTTSWTRFATMAVT